VHYSQLVNHTSVVCLLFQLTNLFQDYTVTAVVNCSL